MNEVFLFFCGIQTCCGLAPLGCICSLFGFSLSERIGSDGPWHCPESSFRADQHLNLLPQTPGSGKKKERKKRLSMHLTKIIKQIAYKNVTFVC